MKKRTRKILNRMVSNKVKLSRWERMQLNYVRESLKNCLFSCLTEQPKITIDDLKKVILDHLVNLPELEFLGWDIANEPDR